MHVPTYTYGPSCIRVFVMQRNDLGIPDFNIQLLNSNGVCREIRMPQISSVQSISSDWVNIAVPLNAFSWSPDWSSPPATFRGCNGNNVGAQDITTVQVRTFKSSHPAREHVLPCGPAQNREAMHARNALQASSSTACTVPKPVSSAVLM